MSNSKIPISSNSKTVSWSPKLSTTTSSRNVGKAPTSKLPVSSSLKAKSRYVSPSDLVTARTKPEGGGAVPAEQLESAAEVKVRPNPCQQEEEDSVKAIIFGAAAHTSQSPGEKRDSLENSTLGGGSSSTEENKEEMNVKSRLPAEEEPSGDVACFPGTSGVEERGSGSRFNSEFVRKVDGIPMVRNALERLLSAYGLVKAVNPVLKSGLERSEDVAWWLSRKAEGVVITTKLDVPFRRLDGVAASGVVKVGETGDFMMQNVNEVNRRVRTATVQLRKRVQDVQHVFLEGVQMLLDVADDGSGEQVAVPVDPSSPEAAAAAAAVKSSTEPGSSSSVTVERAVDVTYRLNLGILMYTARKVKQVVSYEEWVKFGKKNFSPEKVCLRAGIIRRGLLAPAGDELRYVDDDELTELDRRLIRLARSFLATAKSAGEGVRAAPSKVASMMWAGVQHAGSVVAHLGEARSLKDVLGIGFNESRLAAEGVRNWVPLVTRLGFVDSAIEWLVAQEKAMKLN